MAKNPPYYPSQLASQTTWLTTFSALLTAAPATYGLVSGDAVAVAAKVDPFIVAAAACSNPADTTPAMRLERDFLKAEAETVVFPLATRISANANVTPENKSLLGVTVRSTVRSVIPDTTEFPVIEMRQQANRVAVLSFKSNAPGTSRAAPYGYTPRLRMKISAVGASPPGELVDVGKLTKSPATYLFQPGDVGKTCTMAMVYEKKGGTGGASVQGPLGPEISFVVG
jgi:hypothetical protein